MPTYTYVCEKCGNETEEYRSIAERNNMPDCAHCQSTMTRGVDAPNIKPDFDDFSRENNGKGRYNKQLNCYVTSVNDAINKASKKGMYVLDR